MWKAIKWLLATLWTFSFGFAVFLLQNWVLDKPLPNLPRFILLLTAYRFIFIAASIVIGILASLAFYKDALRNLEKKVWLYKSTWRLKPTDINPSKAWYDPFFIKRPEVDGALKILDQGQGVLIVGVPLLGKTRCAYEVLKQMRGYKVLRLTTTSQDIAEIQIPRFLLFLKPKLVLFLDDLQEYLDKYSPPHLLHQLHKQSKLLKILATCRTGEELEAVQRNQPFAAFINQNLKTLNIKELSLEEGRILADHFKREWREDAFNGTPGSIVFGLEIMLQRFLASSLEVKTLMRSLYLMYKSGIRSYRLSLAEAITQQVYRLEGSRPLIENAWRWLQKAGYLTIEKDYIVPTHEVYIEASFYPDYEFGDISQDLNSLWNLVLNNKFMSEIFDLALNASQKNDHAVAEERYRRYLELAGPNPGLISKEEAAAAQFNLASLLDRTGRTEEAEKQYRDLIRFYPNLGVAHLNLADLLAKSGMNKEAEQEYREAVRHDPNFLLSHYSLGIFLQKQERYEDAEMEFREAILCDPRLIHPRMALADLLGQRERWAEAERVS